MDQSVKDSLLKNPQLIPTLTRTRRKGLGKGSESKALEGAFQSIDKRLASLQEQIDTLAGVIEKIATGKAAKPQPEEAPKKAEAPKAEPTKTTKAKGVYPPEE